MNSLERNKETALSQSKYKTYPEYKDSGDGWIGNMPSHWKLSRIKHIGKVIGGYAFKSGDFIDSGVNAIKISNVSHLSFDWTDSSYLPLRFLDEQSDYIPPNGSLIFAMTRPIISGGVKVAKLQDDRRFLVNQRVGFLKPSKKVNQEFLMFVTQSESFFCAFENNITTTNQPNISSEGIEDIRFICPNIVEQTQIANFLDHETAKIDILIDKQQQLIKLLKEKRQAVISHAVTKGLNPDAPMKDSDVEWLGEVPEHWEVVQAKYIADITRGAILRPVDAPEYFDENGEWAYLNISDATKCDKYLYKSKLRLSTLGSTKSARVYPNNVIITASATIGKAFINKIKVCIHDGFIPFCNIKLDKSYLYHYLSNPYLYAAMGKSNTQKNIYLDEVKNMMVTFPPKDEQIKIVKYIESNALTFNDLIIKAETANSLMQERRTALISAAVTGKIDVRHFALKEDQALHPSEMTMEVSV